jgi:hypothetical protein
VSAAPPAADAAGGRATQARVAALRVPGLGPQVLGRYAVGGALLLLTAANLVFIVLCFLQLTRVCAAAVAEGVPLDWHTGLVPVGKLVIETLILLGLYVWGFVDVTLALRRESRAR